MRIAVLDDWAGVAADLADWDSLAAEVVVFNDPIPTAQQAAMLQEFEAICVMRERMPMTAALIRALPRLQLIVTSGPRNLSIDLDAARACGVTVCGTQSRKTTTSELTLAMILAQGRGLIASAQGLAAGGFQTGIGRDMAGLRIGLVGLGNVGGQVATLCQAFGSQVSAWSPNLTQERAQEIGVQRAPSLRDLAAGADVLSLHMVLSPRSAGLIDAHVLSALPKDALVVNTSRAGLLERDALCDWLANNPKAQAAIDVFEVEPLPADDPWRAAQAKFGARLLMTPHLGYVSQGTWHLFYNQTLEAVRAYLAGQPIRVLS
ncbi:hydroxyacid dehydrogenase [Thioclava sp. SK-1]|uniref:D-2-hydroxyacid dehydrogenase family protein n=1 Tax=Thioclava sp. SK-1 TaxID=1889770 RepID=UPI0008247BC7|nr:D-2-hydroxyacid dehydrogenase family protein [Thioclava sp. SK-1]OCX60005.1 hydroxyacid dehydrogenase [Thioclava sp. SK-1]